MKLVGVVTGARSDYGIYRPVLNAIRAETGLNLCLFVTGMHLLPEYGHTVQEIVEDGFEIVARVEMLLASDTPEGISKSMGLGTVGFSQAFARVHPDILLLLGDRFEMHAAAVSALPFKTVMAHIHGGESTEGLIDEPIRHSLTKMSHLHFAATEHYARRIIQMGEAPWRVTTSGAPSLDNLRGMSLFSADELQDRFELDLSEPPLLVTFHPVTLEYEKTEWQISQCLTALAEVGRPIVFTYPNADTRGRVIIGAIDEYIGKHPNARALHNMGTQGYFSLLARCAAMVGNSSSGIIEAASFKLPVVNIGNRQRGRVRGNNVIDVDYAQTAVVKGIRKALSIPFRDGLNDLVNPYGDGRAAQRIVDVLKQDHTKEKLLLKRFYDIPDAEVLCVSSSSER